MSPRQLAFGVAGVTCASNLFSNIGAGSACLVKHNRDLLLQALIPRLRPAEPVGKLALDAPRRRSPRGVGRFLLTPLGCRPMCEDWQISTNRATNSLHRRWLALRAAMKRTTGTSSPPAPTESSSETQSSSFCRAHRFVILLDGATAGTGRHALVVASRQPAAGLRHSLSVRGKTPQPER